MYRTIETEKEALTLALELWEFLKNTGRDKKHFHSDIDCVYLAGCPLCQFYIEQFKHDKTKEDAYTMYRTGCKKCCLFPKELCRFATVNSAFSLWDYAVRKEDKEECKKYAEIIYNAIKEKLEAM